MKTKEEKWIIDKLNSYSEEELSQFRVNKEVYYDAMEDTIILLKTKYEEKSGQSIETLKNNLSTLKEKKESVGQVLNDVELTIEFDVD